jgi:hypothetical protein
VASLKKDEITTDNGEKEIASQPIIISASRATDIPAFYGDWFVHRLNKGYIKWKNPFNGKELYVSLKKTRFIVFWSKDYLPFLKHLPAIDEKNINYYFQFTINDYAKECYERVPFQDFDKKTSLQVRINTFKQLVDYTKNPDKVIWRFDPMLLTDKVNISQLLEKLDYIGNQLKGYTKKLVISFADTNVNLYKNAAANLKRSNVVYNEWDERLMNEFSAGLQELNKQWGFVIGTCAEKFENKKKYGIIDNKCIDDKLIAKLSNPGDPELLEYLGYSVNLFGELLPGKPNKKDKGQREFCGCIVSKDIGQYHTCPHQCVYCYANMSKEQAEKNYNFHLSNPYSDTIIT